MHCVSAYPCDSSLINMPRIAKLNSYFKNVGFSDHTQGILAAIASLKYSPVAIEKHFTVDNQLEGADHAMSASPQVFKEMVDLCNNFQIILIFKYI